MKRAFLLAAASAVVFSAGFLFGTTRRCTAAASPVRDIASLPVPGYFANAETLLVSCSLGNTPARCLTIPLSKPAAERLRDALAADLAARPVKGRLTFQNQFQIALGSQSGVIRMDYSSTAGAAEISMPGYGYQLLAGSSLADELIRLIGGVE